MHGRNAKRSSRAKKVAGHFASLSLLAWIHRQQSMLEAQFTLDWSHLAPFTYEIILLVHLLDWYPVSCVPSCISRFLIQPFPSLITTSIVGMS